MKTLFSIFTVAVAAVAISCGNVATKPAADTTDVPQQTVVDDTTECCGDSTKCCDDAAAPEAAK